MVCAGGWNTPAHTIFAGFLWLGSRIPMTEKVDLFVLPIARQAGQDQPALPGLHVATAPRRAPRGRAEDQLVIHLHPTGADLSARGQAQLVEALAQKFYETPGAVTTALRTALEAFNLFLLDRNLRSANPSVQATGWVTMVAVHRNRLYLAQSGPTHIFTVSQSGAGHFHAVPPHMGHLERFTWGERKGSGKRSTFPGINPRQVV